MKNSRDMERWTVGDAVVARFSDGLKVVAREDHRSPVAVCNVWVRVGSNLETDSVRGWAHGIEHMLFKGTTNRGENDFAFEVADIGGSTNAGTGYETTNYHITVPAENLHRAADILADAVFHSVFDPDALDAERQVLVHENHMYDDLPSGFGVTWRWGMELAFDQSPYRNHIGGPDESLTDTPREKILDFYRTMYRPDNITVVVVGAFATEELLELIAERFRPPRVDRKAPEPPAGIEKTHDRLRYRFKTGDIQRAYGKLIFPAPAANDPDRAVLSVIRQILSDGRSCRLHRRVQQEQQLVNAITMLDEAGPREGLLVVDFESDPAKTMAALESVAAILEEMRREPPTVGELAKAKIRAERAHLFALETVQGQAANLGWHDAMGDLAAAFDTPRRIAAVTAEDVRRVCLRIFRRREASILLYLPRDRDNSAEGIPEDADEMESRIAALLGDGPPAAAAAAQADPDVDSPSVGYVHPNGPVNEAQDEIPFEEFALEGGSRLYCRTDRSLPVFCLGIHVIGGVWREAAGKEGLASLCQAVQAKAARGETPAELQEFIESHGASLSPFATRDHTGLYLTGLTRHLPLLVERMAGVAGNPDFAPQELEKERLFAVDELQSLADDPFQCAARALREAVYGNHPYGHPLAGTEKSLPGIVRADLEQYHRSAWATDNILIAASGDIDLETLAPLCADLVAQLPDAPAPAMPDMKPVPGPEGIVRLRLSRQIRQSTVLMAWPGPESPNHLRPELALLRSLLNGQSGRLFESLRNRRSLCYASGLQTAVGFGTGMLVGYVMTDPEQEKEAGEAMAVELLAMAETAAPAAEFERARARLIGNYLISRQSGAARVGACAQDLVYGRGPNDTAHHLEDLRAVTPDQVRDTAALLFGAGGRHEVTVGPPLNDDPTD